MRTDKLLIPDDDQIAKEILEEAEYYQLPSTIIQSILNDLELISQLKPKDVKKSDTTDSVHPFTWLPGGTFFQGTTILSEQMENKLNQWYKKPKQKWKLIWKVFHWIGAHRKGKQDGFDAKDFHRLADGKSPSYVIIHTTKGNVFGGYSTLPWKSGSGSYEGDPNCFLFTLYNPVQVPPTQFFQDATKPYQYSIHQAKFVVFVGNSHMIGTVDLALEDTTFL